jgi:hypothetical protein
MTFHLPRLFVCLLDYLHACQRTFRDLKNDRFRIFSFCGTSPSSLRFFGTLVLSTWACTLPLRQHIPSITILFSTIFCSTPFWFRSPKTGFGDPVTSPLILAKFAMLPAFVSLLLYRVKIYITFLSPCLLGIRLLQYHAVLIKIYHFSITVLIQDKTFTIPCPALI